MEENELNKLRYPVGKFSAPKEITAEHIKNYIKTIEEAPAKYRKAVQDLNDDQLDTPYRPDGWTIREVVHHVPDSHINSYVRFKLGLTEENPTIKNYDEAKWAELDDSKDTPVEVSLTLLESLHQRWTTLLRSMSEKDFHKVVNHPEWGELRLDKMLSIYDWHCKHHLAHITNLCKRMGW
ncbi:MAG: bacillithiol transferase BstA [Ignavibacteriaceae bacterium]